MLNQDPCAAISDHCLPSKGSNPVLYTGQDNHHSALSWNGTEEQRAHLGKWNKKDPTETSVYLQLPTFVLHYKKRNEYPEIIKAFETNNKKKDLAKATKSCSDEN